MDARLRQRLIEGGAVFDSGAEPLHFGDAAAELRAALDATALIERSTLGRLLGTGPDLLDLLNRLSTAGLRLLEPGRGAPTVITTPKGRIVERLFVHHLGAPGVLLVGGRGAADRTLAHLKRYTFAEDTGLCDVSDTTVLFALLGPRAGEALQAIGLEAPAPHGVTAGDVRGHAVHVLGQDGLSSDGLSILADRPAGAPLWAALSAATVKTQGRPCGLHALEGYRVLNGLPDAGSELTEQHNPLEAGLHDAVSFDKGCYVGQEVVARLQNYDRVSRRLFRLELTEGSEVPSIGTQVFQGGRELGRVSSAVLPPGLERPMALAYLKLRHLEPDAELQVGDAHPSVARTLPLD